MLHSCLDAKLTYIIIGWKGLPGTNNPAYYEHCYIADVKGLTKLGSEILPTPTEQVKLSSELVFSQLLKINFTILVEMDVLIS